MRPSKNQWLSYLLTFAIYATVINWKVAAILMFGVAFHECGHLWAANRMGLKTAGFFLYPFVGGAALITERYRRFSQQSFTVLMGPMWGAALSFAFYGLYLATGLPILGQAAEWMALINLFNLAPLSQLDGGQIMETITFSINETLGVVLMGISTVVAVIYIWTLNPIISALIVFFGGTYLWATYNNWNFRRTGRGYLATPLPKLLTKKEILYTTATYLATAGSLYWLYNTIKTGGQVDYMTLLK
jgi:Zn-dependent protease